MIRVTETHSQAVSLLKDLPGACTVVRREDAGQLNRLRNEERDHLREIESRIAALGTISREKGELKNSGGLNATLPLGLLKQKLSDLVELRRDVRLAEREGAGTHQDAVANVKRPSVLPPLLMLLGGAALITAGLLLPLPAPFLTWVLVALGGGAAGAGFWGWSNFARSAGQVGLALAEERRIARQRDHLARCRGQLNDAQLDFNASLAVAGIDPVADPEEAEHLLDDLAERRDRLKVLETEHRTHEEFLTRERADLARITGEIKVILDRLGLKDEPRSDAEAARLLDLVPRFEKAVAERDDSGREIDRLTKRLAEGAAQLRPDETPAISETALAERIDTEIQRAEEYGKLVKEIADIEARVEVTSKGHELQEALAGVESASAALADVRAGNRESALGNLLLDRVEQQHEKESRPRVLESADTYFQLFTRQTHRLKLAARTDGEDRFLAVAEHSTQPLELHELSDGTRAQLLLAVKLAFMTVAEEGARPPIFLDDSLTSADPERFAAVIESLGQLAARENRQIFYLTPNPSDAAALQRALAETGLPAAHHIDLGRVRGLAQMTDPSLLDPANLPDDITAPDPASLDAAEYAAALLVPQPDAWAPRGMLHVFHLLDDRLELVRRLVDGNAANVGRFASGRETLTAAGIISADEAALVDARTETWNAWLDGWRIGRTRPVPHDFLKKSSAVSGNFIAPVTQALEDCRWDGAGLLQAIAEKKVKGFRANKLEELRQELDDAGLLAHGAPLTDDDLITHTRDRVAPLLAAKVLDMAKVRTLALTFARLVDPRETC
jgi:hypothetical protein